MKATHKQSCADCGHYFWYGEMVFHSKHGYRNFICQNCAEKENESMKCRDCGRTFNDGDIVIYAHRGCYCTSRKCVEKEKFMPNIKITAEVNGKQVPLKTISAETFEAIKALEKPKEIPVARVAKHYGDPLRLLIKPTRSIDLRIGRVYAIDLQNGALVADWEVKDDEHAVTKTYTAVKPL